MVVRRRKRRSPCAASSRLDRGRLRCRRRTKGGTSLLPKAKTHLNLKAMEQFVYRSYGTSGLGRYRYGRQLLGVFMSWFTLLVIALAIWLFFAYNKLRRLAENVKRWQANIAATVKKRHDIAQRLADIAASYGDHEKLNHFTIAEAEENMEEANAAAAEASSVIGKVQDRKSTRVNTTH